jgi:heavy metal sensor kinase
MKHGRLTLHASSCILFPLPMSLRFRLTAAYSLFFALALLLLGVTLYLGVQQLLLKNIQDELRVSSALVQQAYGNSTRGLADPILLDVVRTRPLYVRIFDPDRRGVPQSTNWPEEELFPDRSDIERVFAGSEVSRVYDTSTNRVLSMLIPLRANQQVIGAVQVAQPMGLIDRAADALAWALAGGGLIALLAATRGGLWLTRAALRPIDDISATAAGIIHAEDLQQRVPAIPTNDELGRLTRTINAMLERMERTFQAQQRFTADVAHELRTPLAAMRGNLEILRRGAQHNPVLLDESLRDIESEVLRLTRMANDLLLLSQADAGVSLRPSEFQLDDIVLEVSRELRAFAGDVQLRVDLRQQVPLHGDRDRVKQALINLIANAIQHTPAGGTVTVSLDHTAMHAVLAVADTGSGMSAEQQQFIFDRFYRGDAARSRSGAGLGLSIVKWVAEAHGGQVYVESQLGHGTRFTIELPLTPGDGASLHLEEATSATAAPADLPVHQHSASR